MPEIPSLGGQLDAGNAYAAMSFLRGLIKEATGQDCDSGGGLGSCDLWFTYEGTEYFVQIKRAGHAKEAESGSGCDFGALLR